MEIWLREGQVDEPNVRPWYFMACCLHMASKGLEVPTALVRRWKVTERASGSADARLEKGVGNIIFMAF